jgi:hypothetical protein
MHGGDPTATPRFRFGRQHQTTIAFVQSGQQIRQARLHRPELLGTIGGHSVDFLADSLPRLRRHATRQEIHSIG